MKTIVAGVVGTVLGATAFAFAGPTQIGDFRLPSSAAEKETYFNTFSFKTRSVTDAPVSIVSTFSGTSQNADDQVAESGTKRDVSLRTYTAATNIRTISRFEAKGDNLRAGAVAWTFDLAPLEKHLDQAKQSLEQLTLRLNEKEGGGAYHYDVYLTYTDPSAGLTYTALPDDPAAIYTTFTKPAEGKKAGDTVDGKFVVLASDVTKTELDLTHDLTKLYQSGVRQFSLIIASDAYGDGRAISVLENSGLFIETAPKK